MKVQFNTIIENDFNMQAMFKSKTNIETTQITAMISICCASIHLLQVHRYKQHRMISVFFAVSKLGVAQSQNYR